jgi:NAD(P)H-flavin reductase/ferredoxin
MPLKRLGQIKDKFTPAKSTPGDGITLTFNQTQYSCRTDETVLDALLRQNVKVPYACKQQICQNCLMQTTQVQIPREAQKNLRPTLIDLNCFLACALIPEQDMDIRLYESIIQEVEASVETIEILNDHLLSIKLIVSEPFNYHAGQSVVLLNAENKGKPFFIASPTREKQNHCIEIHTPLIRGSYFTNWLSLQLKPHDKVKLLGPMGHHFYVPDRPDYPILLLAQGYGLSPLVGILLDALESGHYAPIYLFHEAMLQNEQYLIDDLQELQEFCQNFYYLPGTSTSSQQSVSIVSQALDLLGRFDQYRVFICGNNDFVKHAQKQIYLNGASTKDIYAIFLAE